MVNEVVDLLDAVPVPCHLLLIMDTLHECSQPAIGTLNDVVFSVVNLQEMDVVGGAHGIGDGIFVNQELLRNDSRTSC